MPHPSHRAQRPSPSPQSVQDRGRVSLLAPADPSAALALACTIAHPWYRVQALATVAEHAAEADLAAALDRAARDSMACHDAYGRVAVMAWPIGAALRRGCLAYARRERDRVLALAEAVEPRDSQAFALELLWTACHAVEPAFAVPVWRRVLALCDPDRSWRAERLYRHLAEALDERHAGAASSVIRAMPQGKARRRLERRFSGNCG
jgi:hypothetical protein